MGADLASLPALEMARLAVCDVAALPPDLLSSGAFPSLAWASLGGCPAAAPPPEPPASLPAVAFGDLPLGAKLGDGASGEVFLTTLNGAPAALKIFRRAPPCRAPRRLRRPPSVASAGARPDTRSLPPPLFTAAAAGGRPRSSAGATSARTAARTRSAASRAR